jgi:hypothetical protein
MARETQHQHSQDHGVVRAQQPFEGNEETDGDEIRGGEIDRGEIEHRRSV